MEKALLSVKDLTVKYKTDLETVNAVNGISFEVKKGETLGIVGETGAGKTTLALTIMRLLPERTGVVDSGEIFFDDNELLTLSEPMMRTMRGGQISMIFQDPMTALNPIMTVGEQILETLTMHNYDNQSKEELDKRVNEVLELVEIPASRRNNYPHEFSGGMKQRVMIAIALACEPALLIADEPTTALDVTIQMQVLAMMKDMRQKLKQSMIMITHDFGIVAQICDSVAVMYAGEIIESGTDVDIFTADKHHPYTVGLFGSIPNLKVKTKRLSPIEGLMPDPTNLPSGCAFHPRCPECMDICKTEKPKIAEYGTHKIACHLYANKEV